MERIRTKQQKYHQEQLPRSAGPGQDGARSGESRGVPPVSPPHLQAHGCDCDPSPTPIMVEPRGAVW